MWVVVRGWMTPRIALRLRNRADPGLVSVRGLERPGSQRNTKGLVMSIKLTETQQLLLSAASKCNDRCLVLPSTLKGSVAQKVAAKLVAAGLAKETGARADMAVWRRDETTGRGYSLKLTAAGAKAIGSNEIAPSREPREEGGAPNRAAAPTPITPRGVPHDVVVAPGTASASESPPSPRGGTKIAQVVELIQRDSGATLDELIASTGWLPHTTRAALTGLRKRGYAVRIDRSDKERGSTYRISGDEKSKNAEIAAQDNVPSAPHRLKRAERATVRQARKAA